MKRSLRIGLAAGLLGAPLLAAPGCQQQPITANVRSLERSGKMSLVCLAEPQPNSTDITIEARPLSDCTSATGTTPDDFINVPTHLYGLVTQTARGEVAVVDLSSVGNNVIDEDCDAPGANFLPIGGSPQGIVSTPGSTATFVATAEIGRRGIFALPSHMIRPPQSCNANGGTTGRPPPTLSSWPSCSLPSAPGEMVLAIDPAQGNLVRPSCDKPYEAASGALSGEANGRQKLIVSLPALGQLVVIDAQSLLEQVHPGEPDPEMRGTIGSFPDCTIERTIPLEVKLTPVQNPFQPTHGPECVDPPRSGTGVNGDFAPRPAGLAIDNGRLYVADSGAPVIHVVDLPTPCDAVEREPLLPSFIDDPARVVRTRRVAVAPTTTTNFKRHLYAIDEDGEILIFDVSDDSTTRAPLLKPHPEWNPLQPRDRILMPSPARDIIVVAQDIPEIDPSTGLLVSGVLCNPEDKAAVCSSATATCDEGTLYRTTEAYDSGAGPRRLRGLFAFTVLANGRLGVIDEEDYDGPCRTPNHPSKQRGCPPLSGFKLDESVDKDPKDPTAPHLDAQLFARLIRTNEASCNVFEPNAVRSDAYVVNDANGSGGHHVPGITAFPQLFNETGGLVDLTKTGMMMRVPIEPGEVCADVNNVVCTLSVGGTDLSISTDKPANSVGTAKLDGTPQHTLRPNLEEPRAHDGDQNWNITFEGQLPMQASLARLDLAGGPNDAVVDANGRFCAVGVQSQASVALKLSAEGVAPADVVKLAPLLADIVEIADDIPLDTDPHWANVAGQCDVTQCTDTFGTLDAPTEVRDLRILEAYQGSLHVERATVLLRDKDKPYSAPDQAALTKCCFPTLVPFTIRPKNQWVVVGDRVGFLSHEAPDGASGGACRDTCDPVLERFNARTIAKGEPALGAYAKDLRLFINPMFRFYLDRGDTKVKRDWRFAFSTSGTFIPLIENLATDTKQLVAPQSMLFATPLHQLAIIDASSEGVILVNSSTLSLAHTYF